MKYLLLLIGLFIGCEIAQVDPSVPNFEEACDISDSETGLIGTLAETKPWAGNSFNRYNLPYDSIQHNCSFKFYEDIDWVLPDQVELVKWGFHDVGAAKYIVYDKVQISGDSSMYYLEQEREWWNGKYNNNGYCSGGEHAVGFPHCTDYTEVAEVFGLKKVESGI